MAAQVSTRASRDFSDRHSHGLLCIKERSIAGDDDEIRIAYSIRRGEVDRVVTAQPVSLGEITSAASESVVDIDEIELLAPGIEFSHGLAKLAGAEPSKTMCLGKRSPALGVDKTDAHDAVGSVPQRCSTSGADLSDEQRDDRGRIEVRDQRRWLATRSETLPLVLMGLLDRRFGFWAGATTARTSRRSDHLAPCCGRPGPPCQGWGMKATEKLSRRQVSQSEGLADWRVLLHTLQASFRTGSMAKGIEFATRIGVAAEEANHHPDLTITYSRVHLLLTTHDANDLTARDVALARTISAVAVELDITAEPTGVSQLEIAIDALDIAAVKPFWQAVLGYKPDRGDDCVDPCGRGPGFWFQQMDAPRPQRNRIHIDVTVPHDVAEQRIAAALAAGGTLVSDKAAPAFWVLADPEGNEACICTWQGRD